MKPAGKMNVFLTSPWIPPEWIRAHGLQPRGIWSAKDFQHGAWPLSAGVCAFAEAAVRFAETQTDSAVIFSTSCDQMRRGFDTAMLRSQNRAFLFNLPATWQTAAAGRIFRSELERLGQFLLTIGGRAPSAEGLREILFNSSRTRERLLQSAAASSPRGFAEAVAWFHWDGSFSAPRPAAPANQIPLALIGGPFPASHWKWLGELETAGGWVALNATETGERSLSPAFAFENGVDPFDTLVRSYCDNIIDVFQRPNTRLYSWLKPRLAARHARGIVLWHFTGCDLWRAEAQTLRESFGLLVLLLEASAEPGLAPRERTRLQAFVEMLR
jgi:benzoyl-CoA reductase/2-hydroxyglutaryl-CoA dehydratase subunit BcrC/BadD/HgdB